MTSDGVGSPPSATLYKKFKVVEGGYNISKEKRQTDDPTLDGIPDISEGGIYTTFQYMTKCYQEDPNANPGGGEPDWGTVNDLEQFFNYNNPLGTPSDVLTLIDHLGTSHLVVFMTKFDLSPVTVMLEGVNAIYFVPVVLKKVG